MRDYSVSFKTELFDYRKPLPEEANTGNRFYGKDVAEFLSKGLADPALSVDYLDEDWGWLVLAKTNDGKFIEVAVYNLGDETGGGRPGSNDWVFGFGPSRSGSGLASSASRTRLSYPNQ